MAEVHISCWFTRELDEQALGSALDQLSAEERARHARLQCPGDRRDFAAAHLLLRRALSAHEERQPRDWMFVAGRNGKPILAQGADDRPDLSFNLAHTDGLVACVVTRDADVGIDVERVNRGVDSLEVARHQFSPIEVRNLERCQGDERATYFTEIWTLKESYLKATGEGIPGGLHRCSFVFEGATSLQFQSADRSQATAWTFALLEVKDYRLAVAVRDAAQRVTLHLRNHGRDDGPIKDEARLLRASSGLVCSQPEAAARMI